MIDFKKALKDKQMLGLKESDIFLYFDAACKNDGSRRTPMGIGVWGSGWTKKAISVEIACFSEDLGTSYVGEALALNLALSVVKSQKLIGAKIFGDNQTVINQVNGLWMVKEKKVFDVLRESKQIVKDFDVKVMWIKRNLNSKADELSKMGLKAYIEKYGFKYKINCYGRIKNQNQRI